jgi:ABC-2 type transport system permease protein
MKLARDTWLIFLHQFKLLVRNPIWVVIGIVQPLFYMLLFGPLLKSALQVGTDADAYRIFVPGLLVLLALFGPMFAGFGLIAELRAGVIERSRVTPVSRLALLLGRSLRDVVSVMFQAAIITVLGLFWALTVPLGDLLLAYALLSLVALMLSAASYAIALKVRTEDAMAPLLNMIAQPILLLSGILLPLRDGPDWLRAIAAWNPFSWVVDAVRELFASNPGATVVWKALLITAALTALATMWAARAFARSVR